MPVVSPGDIVAPQVTNRIDFQDANGDSYLAYTIDSNTVSSNIQGANTTSLYFNNGPVGGYGGPSTNVVNIDPSITFSYVAVYFYYYNASVDNLTINLPDGWTSTPTSSNVGSSNHPGSNQYNVFYDVRDENGVFKFQLRVENPESIAFQNLPPVCFTKGSQVKMADGQVKLIEELSVGDLVETKDHGIRPIRWVGTQKVSPETLAQFPERRPVKISAGAIGNESDLVLSQQHRVLIQNDYADILFDEPEVLVAAKHLVNDSTIRVVDDCTEVEYYHILFDEHELIFVDGMWSESFHPGKMSLDSIGENARNEVFCIFPELEIEPEVAYPPVRSSLKAREVALLNF